MHTDVKRGSMVKCKEHPRYRAVRPPKHDCPTCQAMWEQSLTFDHGLAGQIPRRATGRHCTSDESKGHKGGRGVPNL